MTIAPPPPDAKKLAEQAVGKLTALATLPEVTTRIIATVEDPRSSAAQLHKIVSHDPVLVTRILKVVNSAFYGLPGQVASVERAIVLLGLNAIKNIAVAASIGQMFRGVKLCEQYTAKDLWTHCLSVACVSREIAKLAKLPLADEAFLAGMIHDVGVLVSLQTWPEQLRSVCDQAAVGGRFIDLEMNVIGVDHQMLGRALAAKWQFPASCQMVAGQHHAPVEITDTSRVLVNIVHAADTLCCEASAGFPLTARGQTTAARALAAANVDPAVLDRVRVALAHTLSQTSSLAA
jgi:HD-like signal output (HDOD) protein